MTPTARSVVVGVCLVFVGAPAAARADFLPWSYRNPTNETVFTPDAGAGLSLPNGDFVPGGGADARITAAPVVAWSSRPVIDADVVRNESYTFGLEIRDDVSGAVKALEFSGVLDGSIWLTGSDLSNKFVGSTSRAFDLGANRYEVTLTGFDAPDGYGVDAAGAFTARVAVRALADGNPGEEPPTTTPEPGTLLMAAVGLPLAGLARAVARRRRTVG